jgi:hypothetical protein
MESPGLAINATGSESTTVDGRSRGAVGTLPDDEESCSCWPLVSRKARTLQIGHWTYYVVFWSTFLLEAYTATLHLVLGIDGGNSNVPYLVIVIGYERQTANSFSIIFH